MEFMCPLSVLDTLFYHVPQKKGIQNKLQDNNQYGHDGPDQNRIVGYQKTVVDTW